MILKRRRLTRRENPCGGARSDLRTKLARQASPFLQAGEHIQAVFRAQSPAGVRAASALRCPMCHLVVVTERAILVLDLSIWTYRPTRLRLRHARSVYFGCSGSFTLDGRAYGVASRFKRCLGDADAALAEMMAWCEYPVVQLVSHAGAEMRTLPSPGWYPDPGTGRKMRYWNGSCWTR